MSDQVIGRIHHTENGVVCALNSVGLALPDDTKLYTQPAQQEEAEVESRAAWTAVVLQKYPTAEVKVNGSTAVAYFHGIRVGNWLYRSWSVA